MSPAAHAEALRLLYPRVLAKTLRLTRSVPDAEDAVHDAVERALRGWAERGAPDSPEAWLVTVATNCHRDRLRRGRREAPREDALETLAQWSPWARVAVADEAVARGWKDELLGLLFACCHPVLDEGESAALALATVVGLSTLEIAAAFLVAPRAVEQRLARARSRLRERGDCDGVAAGDGRDRIAAVLRTIHLLFNEGYWSARDDAPIRADLCRLAIGLARSTVAAFPDEAEAAGLLSLVLLHDARRGARSDRNGESVPLPAQDRGRWDREAIVAATTILDGALALGRPGPHQIEAAIAAVHCRARRAEDTEWMEIADLYALLEGHRPTPTVRVNRAFAVARARGPAAGLRLLERDATVDPAGCPYVHVVRGTLLAEMGHQEEARSSLRRAEQAARNAHERAQIRGRIEALGGIDTTTMRTTT